MNKAAFIIAIGCAHNSSYPFGEIMYIAVDAVELAARVAAKN